MGTDATGPVRRAAILAAAERALGLHVEPAAYAWLAGHSPLVMTLAAALYAVAHVAVTGWTLIWTWVLRRDAFPIVRDTLVVTQVTALAVNVVVPTAPPRLVPGNGIGDEVAGTSGSTAAQAAHAFQSQYAATPSGHAAFALVAGGTFALFGDGAGCARSDGRIRRSSSRWSS